MSKQQAAPQTEQEEPVEGRLQIETLAPGNYLPTLYHEMATGKLSDGTPFRIGIAINWSAMYLWIEDPKEKSEQKLNTRAMLLRPLMQAWLADVERARKERGHAG